MTNHLVELVEAGCALIIAGSSVVAWILKPWRMLTSIERQQGEIRDAVLDIAQLTGVQEGSALRRLRTRQRAEDSRTG